MSEDLYGAGRMATIGSDLKRILNSLLHPGLQTTSSPAHMDEPSAT